MKKNLLTEKELEWLKDNHSNIKPYFTSMIRSIEWHLYSKNTTPADADRLNKQLLAEKQKRTDYIRKNYIKDVDLKAYFAEKAKKAKAIAKQNAEVKKALMGLTPTLIEIALNVTKIEDMRIKVSNNPCTFRCYETKYRARGCRFPITNRYIEINIQKGYHLATIGGVLTFIKGDVVRSGMPCYWVESYGKCQVDKRLVKGFLVKGEHIEAKSLKTAQKLNTEHRKDILANLVAERAKINYVKGNEANIYVTFEDSLKAGNCRPGTQSFYDKLVIELGHDIDALSLKDLRTYGKKFNLEYYTNRVINYVSNREIKRVKV